MDLDEQKHWSKLRVLDGGFGSQLENSGFSLKNDPLWSARAIVDRPDLVVGIHKKFIEAGARVILTNSYHANIQRMMECLNINKNEAASIVIKSVDLARQAVSECGISGVEVVGSVGPYATLLSDCSEYNGHYVDEVPEEEIVQHHMQQSLPLLQAGLKVLAFETIPALLEAKAVLATLDKLRNDMKCWISLACQDGKYTNHGDSFECIAKMALRHPKVIGIGINCTHPSYISNLLKSIDGSLNGKIAVVYPNSGKYCSSVPGKSWDTTSNSLVTKETVAEWQKLGVRLVGGCCGVTPQMIGNLAKHVNQLEGPVAAAHTECELSCGGNWMYILHVRKLN